MMKVALMVLGVALLCGVAQAATIEEVKRYGASYQADLPNFVCTYRETVHRIRYYFLEETFKSSVKLKKWHTGELRWNRSDTRWNRRVLTFKGKPTKKKLPQVSGTLGNYGVGVEFSDWEWKKTRDAEQGEDGVHLEVFEVSSETGLEVHGGLNKYRRRKKPIAVPVRGELWAEEDTGRIRKAVLEYSSKGNRYNQNGWMKYEYAYVNIDGKSYLLPKTFTFESRSGLYGRLVRIEHYNYRRFQSKATIRP